MSCYLTPSLSLHSPQYWIPKSPLLHQLGRRIGFVPMLFFGVFGLPLGQPKPSPLNMVIGAPIPFREKSGEAKSPSNIDKKFTDEDVVEYQERFIASMQNIFDENKAKFGLQNTVLRIV